MNTGLTTADGVAGAIKPAGNPTLPARAAYYFFAIIAYFIVAVLITWPRKDFFIWGDDTYLLSIAANHNMLDCLFGSAAAAVSQADFEPLLGPIFRVYWLLFGLDAGLYYWITPVLLAASALAAYCLFTRLVPNRLYAVFCGAILAFSPATVSAAGNLTCHNYVWGLIIGLASICFARDFVQQHCPRDLWLAIGLSFLAVLLKSLYFPISIVNLYLIVRGRYGVKKVVTGFAVMGLIYFGLRAYALKTIVNVYTDQHDLWLMILGAGKSVPRLLETVTWGVVVPGEPNYIAVAVGALMVLGTLVMAYIKNQFTGVLEYLALLFFSICIPAFVFWLPIISYFNDQFLNMGDRLVIAAVAVIWLSFLYYGYQVFFRRYRFNKFALIGLLSIGVTVLCLAGGLPKSQAWASLMMSNSQVEYLRKLPKGKYLVVAEPAWFIQPLNALIMQRCSDLVLADAIETARENIPLPEFTKYFRFTHSGKIVETEDMDKAKEWLEIFRMDFCQKFPFHCAPQNKHPKP